MKFRRAVGFVVWVSAITLATSVRPVSAQGQYEVLRSFVNARLRAECIRKSNECRRTEARAKSDG